MAELEFEPGLHDPRAHAFTVLPFILHCVYNLCPTLYIPLQKGLVDEGQCEQYFASFIDILQADKIPLLLLYEHLLAFSVPLALFPG